MEGIVVALIFGCAIGLFIGARVMRSPQPHITIVQIAPAKKKESGCMPSIIVTTILIIAVTLAVVMSG